MESRESSSPIVTRAVAAGLAGNNIQVYQFNSLQKAFLGILSSLPQGIAQWLIPRVQSADLPDPQKIDLLELDDLLLGRLSDYEDLTGRYPSVVIGPALGGASTQISLGLGGAFLPQSFVMTLKGGTQKGDAREYFQRSAQVALRFAQRFSDTLTIQHFDPVHDGWLTRTTNHLRIKLMCLPGLYKKFILERVKPGGTIVFLDCGAKWLRYRIGERSVFQVGGWGGITPDEFLYGSPRLEKYCNREKLDISSWSLDGYPLEEGPESEWGSESGMAESIKEFCVSSGYTFKQLTLPNPNDFSRLAFRLVKMRLEKAGKKPRGVLIEMFSQFDSFSALQGGLLPLWLIFNTSDSLEFLKKMVPEFPEEGPVFFSPLSTFTLTPDIVDWQDWMDAFGSREITNIGARQSHYPADTRALLSWNKPLRQFSNAVDLRNLPLLSFEEMLSSM